MKPKREMNEKFFFDPCSEPTPFDEMKETMNRSSKLIKEFSLMCIKTIKAYKEMNDAMQHLGRSSR